MKTLILAGGGHGHINILKNLIREPIRDLKIILISEMSKQYYSGMLSGYIEGIYSEDEISFNLKDLCKLSAVDFIEETIVKIDGDEKVIHTNTGTYPYDYLSINLGGQSINYKNISPSGKNNKVALTKPIFSLLNFIREENFNSLKAGTKLFLIGGGASSVELAIALKNAYPGLNMEIFTKSKELIKNFNPGAKREILACLSEYDIKVNFNYNFTSYDEDYGIFSFNGEEVKIPRDYLLISSGIKGPNIEFKGMEISGDNFIKTDEFLFVNDHTLAMGDGINFNDSALPKAGVFAIHQAPILYSNLKKMIRVENDFLAYRPSSNYLQIINKGKNTAILNWWKLCLTGRIPYLIKDYIDRRYMKIP